MPIKNAFNLLLALALATASFGAFAQNSPIGKWHTIDDETGKVKSSVEIFQAGDGTLQGKVLELINSDKGPDAVCDACEGDRHNKPIKGMVIAWGMKPSGKTWKDGKILDPKSGKIYSAKMTPSADGKTLDVRGYMGFSLLGRTQTWQRIE